MQEVDDIIERLKRSTEEEIKDFLLVDLYERYGKDKFTPYLLLTTVIRRLLGK